VAAFVRVEREVEDVRGWLEAFAEAPEAFARMGENGRRRLGELHRPADYVAALLRAAEHAGRRPALPLAELLAERVGRELGWWTPPDADDVFTRVAEEIHRLVA
jgi:hypothetical protein